MPVEPAETTVCVLPPEGPIEVVVPIHVAPPSPEPTVVLDWPPLTCNALGLPPAELAPPLPELPGWVLRSPELVAPPLDELRSTAPPQPLAKDAAIGPLNIRTNSFAGFIVNGPIFPKTLRPTLSCRRAGGILDGTRSRPLDEPTTHELGLREPFRLRGTTRARCAQILLATPRATGSVKRRATG